VHIKVNQIAKGVVGILLLAGTAAVFLTAGSDYGRFASTNTAVAVGFKIARTGACAVT